MLAYGVASVLSTLLAGHAERRRVSREALVGVVAVLQLGLLVFLLVWIPDRYLVGVFVAVSTLSGFCDGFWMTQCTCESFSSLGYCSPGLTNNKSNNNKYASLAQ